MHREILAGLLESVEQRREQRVDTRNGASQPGFRKGLHDLDRSVFAGHSTAPAAAMATSRLTFPLSRYTRSGTVHTIVNRLNEPAAAGASISVAGPEFNVISSMVARWLKSDAM